MATDEEKKENKAKGGLLENKLVLLGIIVVMQAAMAFVIVQFVISPKLADVGAEIVETVDEASDESTTSVIISLNELVVSLQGANRGGYLKITIDLEMDSPENATIVTQQLPKLRHIAIMALTTKSVSDLQSHNGKSAFNAELLRKFSDVLPQESLLSVFFSDMVIQ